MTRRSPVPKKKQETKKPEPQFEKFKKLAEEAGCEDSDAAFDATLKRLAEMPPPETVKERKAGKKR